MRQESSQDEVTGPTPGERLLYALGQLNGRWRADPTGSVPPHRIDIEAMARMRWVCAEVEYAQEGEYEEQGVLYLHLPAEVLVIDHRREFPWRLLDVREWAERQEWRDFLRREA